MSSPWFNVPFLYCRFRMVVSHSIRRNPHDDPSTYMTHVAQVVITGAFRLQRSPDTFEVYFSNEKSMFQVQGWVKDVGAIVTPGLRHVVTATRTFSEVTSPGHVVFAIRPDQENRARFSTHGLETPINLMKSHVVDEYVSSEINRTLQSDEVREFKLEFDVGGWMIPATPGELRFDEKTGELRNSVDCCNLFCPGPEFSGVLRLTPDIPAFRIVDDSVEQNPIAHCRIRVRGPDRQEQEFVTDAQGEVFIPRTGDEVYTLLGVVQDELPLAGALLGEWTVESMPDLP